MNEENEEKPTKKFKILAIAGAVPGLGYHYHAQKLEERMIDLAVVANASLLQIEEAYQKIKASFAVQGFDLTLEEFEDLVKTMNRLSEVRLEAPIPIKPLLEHFGEIDVHPTRSLHSDFDHKKKFDPKIGWKRPYRK